MSHFFHLNMFYTFITDHGFVYRYDSDKICTSSGFRLNVHPEARRCLSNEKHEAVERIDESPGVIANVTVCLKICDSDLSSHSSRPYSQTQYPLPTDDQ